MTDRIEVDLGCGATKRAPIGIDCVDLPGVDHVLQLGFERLPFEDETVDKFYAWDFLEHVPTIAVFHNLTGTRPPVRIHYPVIYLMNDIWRCLKRGGEFESRTPRFPAFEMFQDPTHVSVWTDHSFQYYCGAFWPLPLSYGIKTRFQVLRHEHWNGGTHLDVLLRKPMEFSLEREAI